jgi:CheY-like chemotaxis protein
MPDNADRGSVLNVLSLEDSVMDFEIIADYLLELTEEVKITRTDSKSEFSELICTEKYDIILADYKLPGFNALEALELCVKHCPDTPFICVSGAIGEEVAIELMKKGAVDFVMKEKLERLTDVVERALDEVREKKARKRAETQAELAYKILNLLNSNAPLAETILLILDLIKAETQIDTGGIRLKKGIDFPYSCQEGFSAEFLTTENSLLSRDENGKINQDTAGKPMLECICGKVISGRFDTTFPWYTGGGSFWTNDSTSLAGQSSFIKGIFHPRNHCIESGYRSMAIIPIHADKEIVGLLHLNDKRTDRFNPDMIRFFESISDIIGVAFMRKQAQEELEKSHDLLFKLSEQVPGVIYQYRLFPDGRSCFPYASSGMKNIYEVTPEEVRLDATPVFGRLHPEDFDRVSELIFESARNMSHYYCEFRVLLPLQGLRWRYSDAVPEKLEDNSTLWHGIIYDITRLKEAETDLTKKMDDLQRFHNLTVDRELFMIELKKEVNSLLKKIGLPEKYTIVE